MKFKLPSDTDFMGITLLHENNLAVLPANKFKRTTDLVIDKHTETDEYKTCLVNYGTLSAANVEYVRTAPTVNLNGHWTLSGSNNRSTMCLELNRLVRADQTFSKYWYKKSTTGAEAGNAAITYEFYKKVILKKITDLSTEIFSGTHVPSYVGMVLYTNTLKSEDSVKKIYGGNKWKQIFFTFMCGHARSGNSEENDYEKFGSLARGAFKPSAPGGTGYGTSPAGEEYITLTESNLPDHDHKNKIDKTSFTITWNGEVRYNNSEAKKDVMFTCETHHARAKRSSGGKPGTFTCSSMKAKVSGSIDISTSSLYSSDHGHGKLGIDGLYSSDGERKTTNPRLLNMPPFETKYVWIRVS